MNAILRTSAGLLLGFALALATIAASDAEDFRDPTTTLDSPRVDGVQDSPDIVGRAVQAPAGEVGTRVQEEKVNDAEATSAASPTVSEGREELTDEASTPDTDAAARGFVESPQGPSDELQGDRDGGEPRPLPNVDDLLGELLTTSRAIEGRPGGSDLVEFPGGADRPSWFEALVVTDAANPLLEEDCKKQALQLSVASLREAKGLDSDEEALRVATAHVREHVDFVKSHGISYAGYLRSVAECRGFCGPLVTHLIQCQILSVARSTHGVLLFDFDSFDVDQRYVDGMLQQMQSQLAADPSRRAVLIGRASKIGDLRYNRRLAALRALAVRDRLLELDVDPEQISTMWFGWEPPQITASVADEYGLRDLFDREGMQRMNQSVVAVVYGEARELPTSGARSVENSEPPGQTPDSEPSAAEISDASDELAPFELERVERPVVEYVWEADYLPGAAASPQSADRDIAAAPLADDAFRSSVWTYQPPEQRTGRGGARLGAGSPELPASGRGGAGSDESVSSEGS